MKRFLHYVLCFTTLWQPSKYVRPKNVIKWWSNWCRYYPEVTVLVWNKKAYLQAFLLMTCQALTAKHPNHILPRSCGQRTTWQ